MASADNKRARLIFILLTLFLDAMGLGLILPVLPTLLQSFVPNDLGVVSRYYGVLAATYAAMQFACAPVLGALGDRFGRRPILFVSLLGSAMNYVLLATTPWLPLLFVGRVIAGVTGASFSVAMAYVADTVPAEQRAQNFGLLGAASGVGFILGPALGGALGSIHLRMPFLAAAALTLVNLCYGLFVLPESLTPENRRPFALARANPLSAIRRLFIKSSLVPLVAMFVCVCMAQQMLQGVWALYTNERFAWSAAQIGMSFTTLGFAMALAQGGLLRLANKQLGERRAVVTGLAVGSLGLLVFAFAANAPILYAGMIPFAVGAICSPAIQALISREVGPTSQGSVQGALISVGSLTAVVGPILGTTLLSRFAPNGLPGAPFLGGAAFLVLAAATALRAPQPADILPSAVE